MSTSTLPSNTAPYTAYPPLVVPPIPEPSKTATAATLHSAHAIIAVALIVIAFGGWLGFRSYERALQHAETIEAQYDAQAKVFQNTQAQLTALLAQDAQDRAAASAREASLQAQIDARNRAPLPVPVQTGLKPDATAQEAATALQTALPKLGVLGVTPDGKVSSTVPQTQAIVVSIEQGLLAEANLKDESALYTIEQGKTLSLNKDLTSCESTLSEANTTLKSANETIAAYKRVAVKSKWQKIWGGIKTYGGFALGVAVGRKL